MSHRAPFASAALIALLAATQVQHASTASSPLPLLPNTPTGTIFDDCVDGSVEALAQAAAVEEFVEGGVLEEAWPPGAIGGMLDPIRTVYDLFPTFDGIALDTVNDKVIFSDENRHSMIVYDRTAGGFSNEMTEPFQHVFGPKARLGYIAGVEVDPQRKEFYTINNDGGDQMVVFSYGDHGNVTPRRYLRIPHQSWDVSLAPKRDEIAVSVQQSNAISVFNRGASGGAAPIRTIRGLNTQLEDPHGIFFDEQHGEIITANHGNWTQIRPYTAWDPLVSDETEYKPGSFHKASITFHAQDVTGDVAPLRIIEGGGTGLNWPMGLDVDLAHDEIAVANYGDSSIRVFRRSASGDTVPIRILRGSDTGIVGPVGVAIDVKNDELWVANYGDHTAVVFPRTAAGNVKPKRIIRNAPKDTPTCGFTNASAAAYDTKRDQILVPN